MTRNSDKRTTEDIMHESSQAHVIRVGQCTTWSALADVTTQTYMMVGTMCDIKEVCQKFDN